MDHKKKKRLKSEEIKRTIKIRTIATLQLHVKYATFKTLACKRIFPKENAMRKIFQKVILCREEVYIPLSWTYCFQLCIFLILRINQVVT